MHWQWDWQQHECLQKQLLSALRVETSKRLIFNSGLRQPGFESSWGRQLRSARILVLKRKVLKFYGKSYNLRKSSESRYSKTQQDPFISFP